MIKVHILERCEACEGQAYLPDGMDVSNNGEPYHRYKPCSSCQCGGNQTRWVSLEEYTVLLEEARCKHPHISYQGNFHFTVGEAWDDLVEVCEDCGAVLG